MPVYGQANALAMVYLVIAVGTTYFYARMISRAERYTIVTGKGYRPRQQDLGKWKYPALACALLFLFVAVVVPVLVFLYPSFLSYGTRAMNAALLQIHKELEEAAYVSGASPWRAMRRVIVPLLMPTFAGIWIWVVLHAVRVAGMPLILYEGPNNQVLSILIWNMWDDGYVPAVAAIGTLLMIALVLLTVVIRLLSFRRQTVQMVGP